MNIKIKAYGEAIPTTRFFCADEITIERLVAMADRKAIAKMDKRRQRVNSWR